jgi:uncharacterized membrane protein
MKKSSIFSSVAAAILLTVGIAQAGNEDMANMEKCKVVKDGKGMIKAGKGACKTATNSCAGNNVAYDPEAWIMVPKGECDKLNKGDMSGVSDEVKDKLDM